MVVTKIFRENPVLVGFAGLCPAVAVTTTVANGLVLGLGTLVILLISSAVSMGLRKIVPRKLAKIFHIAVAASLTSVMQLLVEAFLPDVAESLGIFIGLIAVNCIVVDSIMEIRANPPREVMGSLVGLGLGFLMVLLVISLVRELGGNGTILGMQVLGAGLAPNSLFMTVPGGLLCLSILTALARWLKNRRASGRREVLEK